MTQNMAQNMTHNQSALIREFAEFIAGEIQSSADEQNEQAAGAQSSRPTPRDLLPRQHRQAGKARMERGANPPHPSHVRRRRVGTAPR